MNVTLLLGDLARVSDGKLDVLGAGWNVTGPAPIPSAIGLLIQVPWDETNTGHNMQLVLCDDKGNVAMNESGEPLARVDAQFEAPQPPGVLLGAPITLPLALNLPPIPLIPNRRYRWRLFIDGKTNLDWEVAFSTRPAGGMAQAAS